MKAYRLIRVDHKIHLRPANSEAGRRPSIRVIHDLRLKPPKELKRWLRFWM